MSFYTLKKPQPANHSFENSEVSEAEFIPYSCHWNAKTLMLKNNWLMQVIKLTGFSFETADDEDVDIRKQIRNSLFKGISTGKYGLYFHIVRRKHNIFEKKLQTDMPSAFANEVEEAWREKHSTRKGFSNELYVSVIRKFDTKGAAALEHLWKKVGQKTSQALWESDMRESYEELNELTTRLTTTLRDYDPEVLGIVDAEEGAHSELLEFLGKIVNCGSSMKMLVPSMTPDRYLSTHRLYFGAKSIEARGPVSNIYAGMVSLKEYGSTTNAGLLDGFLQMPFEFILTQSYLFSNRQVAINKMQIQQNRMIQAEDKAISQIVEITQALDMAQSGDIAFGNHHFTIMCLGNTPKELENNISMATVELSNCGMMPVRESLNMEATFWGQLPGNYDYIARSGVINTMNLAGFVSFHNYPTGKEYGNHWGDPVSVFDTTSGTPFFFNFHLRDVGHTTIIGPTGAGKTVLMNFLCAQAQRFKGRMFFFDKDRGAEIFIRAINGNYTVIDPGKNCYFNPLQLPDNSDNRIFLLDWLKQLVTVNNEPLTAHDIASLSEAIKGNFKLDFKDRKISNIAPFLGLEGPGSLAGRLAMWHGYGSHAAVFDNDGDNIDFKKSSVFGFEMGKLLRDKMTLGPVLLYLFHRISMSLDGAPTMIILDEAWALIDNPIFAPKIKDWLKVMRKLNCMVVFATQSVEDASKSAISDTLIQQTATQIFLPNLKATQEYRTTFMLSEREFALVKNTDPGSRFFLIKQGTNAVVARIDLTGMKDIINVLSGRTETIQLLDTIREEFGDNPEIWLPIFYEKARKIS